MFHTEIPRRKSRQIMVGNVAVGGDAPISVQTMTNTETCNVDATVAQIVRIHGVGSQPVAGFVAHRTRLEAAPMLDSCIGA
jgi:(E)-4-hydroxy-3-methylbut-2-enyl-diphosphate synthase